MPQSLMSLVLRGKYFLSRNFKEVKVSPNANFTWKSILSSRDLILKGVKKRWWAQGPPLTYG